MKFTKFQYEEFSKYWFDLSKLVCASFILKFFEPGAPKFTINFVLTVVAGLTIAGILAILALSLGKRVKN